MHRPFCPFIETNGAVNKCAGGLREIAGSVPGVGTSESSWSDSGETARDQLYHLDLGFM